MPKGDLVCGLDSPVECGGDTGDTGRDFDRLLWELEASGDIRWVVLKECWRHDVSASEL